MSDVEKVPRPQPIRNNSEKQMCDYSRFLLSEKPTKQELQRVLRWYGFNKLYVKKIFLLQKIDKLIFYFQHINEIKCMQRTVRRFILSLRTFLHGDVYHKPQDSTNVEDFCTLEKIVELPSQELISFRNSTGCFYSFQVESFQKLQTFNTIKNPYTRERIDLSVFDRLGEISYRKKNRPKKNNSYTHSLFWTNRKDMIRIEIECRKNNYELNYGWIMDAPLDKLHKLYGTLHDIWKIQHNLTPKIKTDLVPDTNDIITLFPVSKHSIWYNRNIDKVREIILNIIMKLSFSSENKVQIMGVIIILCGMIKINQECHALYSWLDV